MSAAPLCWSCASPRSSMADRPHVALVVHRRGRIVPAGCHTLLQRDGDIGGDEAVGVATEQRHLSDQTRADERVARRRHQTDDLDLGREVVVHVGVLEFVLKVRDGTETSHNGRGAKGMSVLYGQTGK